jgi:hypothetical protein
MCYGRTHTEMAHALGGHENISYLIYYREQGLVKRFRAACCDAHGLQIIVFRLAADTTYDMVAVSALGDDANQLTTGIISISDSSIALADNVTSDLVQSGYFDFGVSSFLWHYFLIFDTYDDCSSNRDIFSRSTRRKHQSATRFTSRLYSVLMMAW